MNKKAISSLIVICFLTLSISHCIAHPESSVGSQEVGDDTLCYGFIVSPVKCENVTIQDQINCKIRHMINDLLREQIPVYWTAEDVDASIIEINGSEEETVSFEKGTFIIPFTGNTSVDTKIIVIMCDYNYSSEIEEDNELKISVYILREPLSNVHVYPLSEVKLAQHKNKVSTGEICFLEISRECGFLSYELLIDSIISQKLNNDDFNVLTHAGGVPEYATFYKTGTFYTLYSDLRYRVSTAVRKFVSNGGGYIGSCYGANMAGSGHELGPITINLKRRSYNPKLPSIGFFCIADYIGTTHPELPTYIQVKIVNDSHPVTYNLDEIMWDYCGGSGFGQMGPNTQAIANFYNTGTYMDDTPSWVSSNFGDGKVIAFSSHPEINSFFKTDTSYQGRTTVSNALFYTTAKEVITLQLTHSRLFTFIEEIMDKTVDIPIDIKPMDIFDEIKDSINEATVELTDLSGYVQQLRDLIVEIADEKNIDLNEKNTFLGAKSLWVTVKYYFDPFKGYLENTMETLNTLEKIYPLLESDPDFVQQIETLKDDISSRIAETQRICSQGYEMCENYEEALLKYQKRPNLLSRLKEFLITDKGHKFYWHIYSVFSYVPQIYFNSLKLLRNSWYNYEASMMEL